MVDAAVIKSLVEMLGKLVAWLVRERRPPDPRPVETVADELAEAVYAQWWQEAAERMLLTPEPIPVGWSLSKLPVAGPPEAAVGSAGVAPVFAPLPGQSRVTKEQLGAGGGRRELFAVYAGIPSGRVVVVGAPGAGKTGSAVLLVLDALEHRKGVIEASQRVRVPVPVLLTAYGWDPVTCPVRDWLVGQLVTSYPRLFAHRGGQAEAAALVTAGAVALVLDGLDEMAAALRPAALRALSCAPFRVVVLTRSCAMVRTARVAWLLGAPALQLRGVTGRAGADYLHRACTGPPPARWTQLLTHLRENPDGALARGLSTPLALTLIRDTYRPGDDVRGLLTTRWSGDDLERYLIARVLPAAYTRRPGNPAPPYSQTQAEQVLAFLARQMNQRHTRNLAWWQIPRWAPTTPRILASMLMAGLLGAIMAGLVGAILVGLVLGTGVAAMYGVRQGFWTVLGANILAGLTFGLGGGLPLGIVFGRGDRKPQRVRNWRAIRVRSVLTAGLGYGLVSGLTCELVAGLVAGLLADPTVIRNQLVVELVGALTLGLTLMLGLSGWRGEGQASPQKLLKNRRQDRVVGLVAGFVLGLVAGVVAVHSFHLGFVVGSVVGFVTWLGFGFVVGLMPRLAGRFVAGLSVGFADGEPSPQGPRESWHHDRVFGLRVGLVLGLGIGVGIGLGIEVGVGLVLRFGLGTMFGFGPRFGLVLGLVLGLVNFFAVVLLVGLMYGITSSATWPTTLAWRQLRRSHRVPAVALMPFLEDARSRHVLRTVGAVYQFRHATLQDQLAGHTTASQPTSLVTQIGA